jgi:Apoptosis inhibitory protein 5 (API5)
VESTPFVKFMCDKLLPTKVWSLIGAGDDDQSQTHLRLLKVFAESCTYCGSLELPSDKIEAVFNQLLVSVDGFEGL